MSSVWRYTQHHIFPHIKYQIFSHNDTRLPTHTHPHTHTRARSHLRTHPHTHTLSSICEGARICAHKIGSVARLHLLFQFDMIACGSGSQKVSRGKVQNSTQNNVQSFSRSTCLPSSILRFTLHSSQSFHKTESLCPPHSTALNTQGKPYH